MDDPHDDLNVVKMTGRTTGQACANTKTGILTFTIECKHTMPDGHRCDRFKVIARGGLSGLARVASELNGADIAVAVSGCLSQGTRIGRVAIDCREIKTPTFHWNNGCNEAFQAIPPSLP